MALIAWQIRRNLENSLAYFLQSMTSTDKVFYKGSELGIDIRVGNAPQDNWKMPNISLYMDSRNAPRAFIGNNKRLKSYLMIIDIRALDDAMRADLAEVVATLINDGFDVYTYAPNSTTPEDPSKTYFGKASIEFVTDTAIRGTQNAELFEKFRHRISINVTIAI